MVRAEGFQATLRHFKRLRQIGDRLQSFLPGRDDRNANALKELHQ